MDAFSNYDVLGLGAPIIDLVVQVDDHFLENVPGEKGGSMVVSHEVLAEILAKASKPSVDVPGGSAANTIIGMASLGSKCGLAGMVGRDDKGKSYIDRLLQKQIMPLFAESEESSTAQVICLITPDGQRTMRCFLGASNEYAPEHLKHEYFAGVKLVHCEGYAIYNQNGKVVRKAMEMAKQAGCLVSLDLASFEIVRSYKPLILELLENRLIDVIFCNEDEATQFASSIDETLEIFGTFCGTSVITMGAKGCWVQHEGEKKFFKTTPKTCIDTTGAGDLFAAGFLHMLMKGSPIEDCCKVAHTLGGAVLSVVGAQLPNQVWQKVHAEIRPLLKKDLSNEFSHIVHKSTYRETTSVEIETVMY